MCCVLYFYCFFLFLALLLTPLIISCTQCNRKRKFSNHTLFAQFSIPSNLLQTLQKPHTHIPTEYFETERQEKYAATSKIFMIMLLFYLFFLIFFCDYLTAWCTYLLLTTTYSILKKHLLRFSSFFIVQFSMLLSLLFIFRLCI